MEIMLGYNHFWWIYRLYWRLHDPSWSAAGYVPYFSLSSVVADFRP
jgi:hypothetical protein